LIEWLRESSGEEFTAEDAEKKDRIFRI